ncbi:MAG: hypothetical protein D8M59_02545 [Planctomycetes bacterium]|nr:hypothetical protein [Planctomycetota bacterium]NOG54401.1 hypothetical protein [Planctomycetota bacterium]
MSRTTFAAATLAVALASTPFMGNSTARAQQPHRAWIETWTGTTELGQDVGWEVLTDSAGNIIVGGSTETDNNGADGLIRKYDRSGHLLWSRTYNGPGSGDDNLGEIEIDSNDNIILHGNVLGNGTGQDFCTIKYSPDGTLLWTQLYDGSGHSGDWSFSFRSTGIDAADNIYVAGYAWTDAGHYECVTIKYAADGTEQWVQPYQSPNPSGNAYGYCVQVTDDGTVYVGGTTTNLDGNSDYLLLKYDTNGTLIWDGLHDGIYGLGDSLYNMVMGPNEDIFLTGIMDTSGGFEYGVVKYNSDGVFQWETRYGGTQGYHYGWVMDVDTNGNVYVSGASETGGGEYDWVTIGIDTNGTLLWSKRFRNNYYFGPDWAYDLVVDDNNDVYVCGYIWEWFAEGHNAAIVKYDAAGNVLWEDVYNGDAGGNDAWFKAFIDDAGQVLLTGTSLGLGTGTDLILAKYRQSGPPMLDVAPDPLLPGAFATFTVTNAEPEADTYLVYSTVGEGNAPVSFLDVTLGLKSPQQAGNTIAADATGTAQWSIKIPGYASGLDVWFQAAQYNVTTNVVATHVQ